MRRVRVLGALSGAAVVLAVGGAYELTRHDHIAGARAGARAGAAPVPPRLSSPADFQRRTGVRIVRVAVSGGGGLLDVRYEVLDPTAAAAIHDPTTPPELVDERTGVVVRDLFMGHSHSGRFKAAETYFLLFDNPGTLVRRGTRVTVQLGAARVAHVRVE
jgi:hypothetical protein